jgi:hypothetical protein
MGFQALMFLFDPRGNIRGLIGTNPWRTVVAFSLTIAVLFCLAIAEMPAGDIPERFRPVAIALVFVVTSVLTVPMFYINALLRSRSGRDLGGRATVWELSAGLAWSTLPWLLYFALGLLIAPFLTTDPKFIKSHLGLGYVLLALGPLCLVWGYLLSRSSTLELQGLTAAQGRAAAWKSVTLQMRWFFLFAVIALSSLLAITLIARFLR